MLGGCTNESARAPNPTGYDWPDTFSYRVEYSTETARDTGVVSRYDQAKLLRFAARDDRYLVWNDSLSRNNSGPGAAPQGARALAEDTLRHFVRLTRLGEFEEVEPDCDPEVAACRDALPSALPLELRRVIPRLPVWWPPKGHTWVDTLRFDDRPRPHGARGALITTYRDLRDTVLAGRSYWLVTWRSVEPVSPATGGVMAADHAIEEHGEVLVDKQKLVPVLADWYGAVAAPPAPRAEGGPAAAVRGRAWLVGSAFDSGFVKR